jgi:ribonuclease-3
MPSPQWSELEQVLGHVFGKRRRLEQALTHSSLAYERATGRGETSSSFSAARKSEARIASVDLREDAEDQDNEQLEFLGDAVLGLIVADCLFRTYPEMNEGDLTRLRAQLVSRRHLGQVGARISLGDYMRLGRGEERSGGRQKAVLLANALEAVIAALYLDDLHSALEAGQAMGDHKSALQEWLQAHKSGSPHYTVKAESGPDHRKRFLVEVQILGENGGPGAVGIVAEGAGSTKKKAEQEAARLAYAALVEASAAEAVPQHIDATRWAGKVS